MLGLLYDFFYNQFINLDGYSQYYDAGLFDYSFEIFGVETSLGYYLSLICSLISFFIILFFCIFLIKKIIGVMFRLFTFGA